MALRRAGRVGDGWLGMEDTPQNAPERVATIRAAAEEAGRDPESITLTVGGPAASDEDVKAYAAAGIDRIIVSPWRKSNEAVEGLRRFAERHAVSDRSR